MYHNKGKHAGGVALTMLAACLSALLCTAQPASAETTAVEAAAIIEGDAPGDLPEIPELETTPAEIAGDEQGLSLGAAPGENDSPALAGAVLTLNHEYAVPDVTIQASMTDAPAGTSYSYTWKVGGNLVATADSYTPKVSDLEKYLTITATQTGVGEVATKKLYISRLPVIYINTADGKAVTSRTVYKAATMKIQGNNTFDGDKVDLYDGAIQIRGRGNTSWTKAGKKRPYKIKLDKKTNLLGFGKSKHWVLHSCVLDDSLMRDKTVYDLASHMGLVDLKSTFTDVIFNGAYVGTYMLVENVRIESNRVDIQDWEGCASDIAKAIGKKVGLSSAAIDKLDTQMTNNLAWITSGKVTYNKQTYKIADYYTDLPKIADGSVDVGGGFLLEISNQPADAVSGFYSSVGNLPLTFKGPDYAKTNPAMMTYAKNYVAALERSSRSADFYTTYGGKRVSYSELADIDSLVSYYLVLEFFANLDAGSVFFYKDIGDKLKMGPTWDFNGSSANSNCPKLAYNAWVLPQQFRRGTWYDFLRRDPYFCTQMYECYHRTRPYLVEMTKDGGIIDQQSALIQESAEKNNAAGLWYFKTAFTPAITRFKTYLQKRLTWMDAQMASPEALVKAFGKYTGNAKVTVSADTSAIGKTTLTANVTNTSSVGVVFYLNGKAVGTVPLTGEKPTLSASLTVDDSALVQEEGRLNTFQARTTDAKGALRTNGTYCSYMTFKKTLKPDVKIHLNTDSYLLNKSASAKLDYTITVNGEEVTDDSLDGDIEVSAEKTGGFEKESLKDLEVLQIESPKQLTAVNSGVVKLTLSLPGYEAVSDNAATLVVTGDVNIDGKISIKDAALGATYLRTHKAPDGAYALQLLDMNADGKVSVKDIQSLIQQIRRDA